MVAKVSGAGRKEAIQGHWVQFFLNISRQCPQTGQKVDFESKFNDILSIDTI